MTATLATAHCALAVVCVASLGSTTLADDFSPPPYRGQPLSLVAKWEFATPPANPLFVPPDVFTVHPTPAATLDTVAPHAEFTATNWAWTNGDGNGEIHATGGPGSTLPIAFKIPNCLPPHALLNVRVQVTYQYPFVGAPGFFITAQTVERLFDKPPGGSTLVTWPGIYVGGAQPDNQHFFQDFIVQPAWHFTDINVIVPFATALDEIVIDAIVLPVPPVNDECMMPRPLRAGLTPFSTLDANPEVSDLLPPLCEEGFGTAIIRDIWYVYRPTCDGVVFLTVCDPSTDYDTRLAVYTGPCDNLQLLACNDDLPNCEVLGLAGFDLLSTVQFEVDCGTRYLIRLGGYPNQALTGSGTGNIFLACNGRVACPQCSFCDLDGNKAVNGADLAILLAAWGSENEADVNGDGTVDAADLAILLASWGPCP